MRIHIKQLFEAGFDFLDDMVYVLLTVYIFQHQYKLIPPSLAMVSPALTQVRNRSAARFSTPSPASCPDLSFTPLKSSKSKNRTASCPFCRAAWDIAWFSRSERRLRLASPVKHHDWRDEKAELSSLCAPFDYDNRAVYKPSALSVGEYSKGLNSARVN